MTATIRLPTGWLATPDGRHLGSIPSDLLLALVRAPLLDLIAATREVADPDRREVEIGLLGDDGIDPVTVTLARHGEVWDIEMSVG